MKAGGGAGRVSWKDWLPLAAATMVVVVFWFWVAVVSLLPKRNLAYVVITEVLYFSYALGVPAIVLFSIVRSIVRFLRRRCTVWLVVLQVCLGVALLWIWNWIASVKGLQGL